MKRKYVSPSIQVFACNSTSDILTGSTMTIASSEEATSETVVESRQHRGSIWDDDEDEEFNDYNL